MTVAVRVDASTRIGHGHVIRCLALASGLADRGADVFFVCREHEGNLAGMLEQRGFPVQRLARSAGPVPSHKAGWLEQSWTVDAEETMQAVRDKTGSVDWLVVDHYGIGCAWEQAMRPVASRIMVIDDLADRAHDCDLLLDQNLIASLDSRYTGLVPDACVTLLGPTYAMLQSEYARLHDRIPAREGPVQKILVSFGGADSANLTARAVTAFLSLERADLELLIVVAGAHPQLPSIRQKIVGRKNVRLECDLPTLAPVMAEADIALGASGSTNWERLCLGLPALVVTLAENQVPIAGELHRLGLVRLLGHHNDVDEKRLADALADVTSTDLDGSWSRACSAVVDGRGVDRVLAALSVSNETALRARPSSAADDKNLVPGVAAKFRRCLRAIGDCYSYTIEAVDSTAIGVVTFSRQNDGWNVAFSASPVYRNCDFRRSAVSTALAALWNEAGPVIRLHPGVRDIATAANGGAGLSHSMRISVCSDADSWVNGCVAQMIADWLQAGHAVTWTRDAGNLREGDICFFLSYGRIVNAATLALHKNNLVVHASDLPRGRGWSPLTWQILEGCRRIPVTLFEAAESVDSGPIYAQTWLETSGLELIDELRAGLCRATEELCEAFVAEYPASAARGRPQRGKPTFYARRRPRDSRIDIDTPLRDHINLLRTADPDRYPVWFELDETRFALRITRLED